MKNFFKNMFKQEVIADISENTNETVTEVSTDSVSETPWQEIVDSGYLLTSPEIVGWLSTEEQELLFSALLLFYNTDQSILDVGCGRSEIGRAHV